MHTILEFVNTKKVELPPDLLLASKLQLRPDALLLAGRSVVSVLTTIMLPSTRVSRRVSLIVISSLILIVTTML